MNNFQEKAKEIIDAWITDIWALGTVGYLSASVGSGVAKPAYSFVNGNICDLSAFSKNPTEITLNLSAEATGRTDFIVDPDNGVELTVEMRFGGRPHIVHIPVDSINVLFDKTNNRVNAVFTGNDIQIHDLTDMPEMRKIAASSLPAPVIVDSSSSLMRVDPNRIMGFIPMLVVKSQDLQMDVHVKLVTGAGINRLVTIGQGSRVFETRAMANDEEVTVLNLDIDGNHLTWMASDQRGAIFSSKWGPCFVGNIYSEPKPNGENAFFLSAEGLHITDKALADAVSFGLMSDEERREPTPEPADPAKSSMMFRGTSAQCFIYGLISRNRLIPRTTVVILESPDGDRRNVDVSLGKGVLTETHFSDDGFKYIIRTSREDIVWTNQSGETEAGDRIVGVILDDNGREFMFDKPDLISVDDPVLAARMDTDIAETAKAVSTGDFGDNVVNLFDRRKTDK